MNNSSSIASFTLPTVQHFSESIFFADGFPHFVYTVFFVNKYKICRVSIGMILRASKNVKTMFGKPVWEITRGAGHLCRRHVLETSSGGLGIISLEAVVEICVRSLFEELPVWNYLFRKCCLGNYLFGFDL